MNTPQEIQSRFELKKLSWWPVLFFLPARFLFSVIAQGLVAALFFQGTGAPWSNAAAWWLVYSTSIDIFCLIVLMWLVKYEGIRMIDLLGVKIKEGLRQLKYAPLMLLALMPFVVAAHLITVFFYGSNLPPMIDIVDMPLGVSLYSLIIWPVIWVLAEQLVYLGYLLPRLEALTGKTWLAGVIIALFWGAQHVAIPFIADETYLIWRLISATVTVGGFTFVYILLKRNFPFPTHAKTAEYPTQKPSNPFFLNQS